jgi:hypothetical protein
MLFCFSDNNDGNVISSASSVPTHVLERLFQVPENFETTTYVESNAFLKTDQKSDISLGHRSTYARPLTGAGY